LTLSPLTASLERTFKAKALDICESKAREDPAGREEMENTKKKFREVKTLLGSCIYISINFSLSLRMCQYKIYLVSAVGGSLAVIVMKIA